MILGVVGDTHNRLSNVEKIIDIFNEKNVDKVIHTGDITQAKTLDRFSRLNCPLIGVYGNNDLEEKGLKDIAKRNGFNFQNPPFFLTISNKKIAIFHEPEEIENFLKKELSVQLIIHGHTHRYRNEKMGDVQIINPGECAGIFKGKNAVGLINLEDLSFERIFF